jgi:hypothetical protein
MVARIATGEIDDALSHDGKDPAAKTLGKTRGAARASKMTPDPRQEVAKRAAQTRWRMP